jgi:nicotinamide-nucleotide amidase
LQPVFHKIILLQGIAESLLAQKIKNWESSLDSNLKLAYLPSPGLMKLRISAYGGNLSDINAVVASKIVELNDLVGEYIYGYDDASLEEIIGALLKEKNKTLSTAESCTGGNIARLITSVPGASEYYIGSVIAYSNAIKQNCLKVKEETIKLKGAVSNEVAEAMAVGVRNLFHTDYAIGISGIAGPTGATENKPVGMTCISVVGPIHKITKTFYLGDNRERNIQKASITALNLLRKLIVSQ